MGRIRESVVPLRLRTLLEGLETRHAAIQARWAEIEAALEEHDRRASAAGGQPVRLSPDDRVEMNIGGLPLSSRRGVLTSVEGSRLAAAFGPRWFSSLPRDREGRVFVDEDPVVFRAVLNALAEREAARVGGRKFCGRPQVPNNKAQYLGIFLLEWGLSAAFAFPFPAAAEPSPSSPRRGGCPAEDGEGKQGELLSPGDKRDPASLLKAVVQAMEEEERALEAEVQRLKAAQRALADEPAFIGRHFGDNARPVAYVSVGGRARAAAVCVVCGGLEESVLGRLFLGERWTLQKKDLDDQGNYRLYIDLAAFDKLLELMRLRVLYQRDDVRVEITGREAEKVEALVRYLFPAHQKAILRGFKWGSFSCSSPSSSSSSSSSSSCSPPRPGSLESCILSPTRATIFQGLFPGRRMTLIYRASRDGRSASRFHHLCDHRGPTVTLIRTDTGAVFGGYTSVSWQGVVPKADPSAFLFTLANPHNVPPQQLRPTGELPEHAVYTHCMFGPTWGSGYDLRVNEDMASGTSNVGRNYAVPGVCGYGSSFDGHTLLAGSPAFKIAELEVFLVQKAMFW